MGSTKNILVVGAGLSGLSVAIHLIKKGVHVTLLDNEVNHSSAIAAGMITPLVFRRMTKSWRVDECIAYLKEFYQQLESDTSSTFFKPVPIRRMFSSEQERGYWLKKQTREDFSSYMELVTDADTNYNQVTNEFGSGRLKNSYAVDTHQFLSAGKKYISKHGTLLAGSFDYTVENPLVFDGKQYDDIVFCEGYTGLQNPFFNYLPLKQTKGQILTISSQQLPNDESVNRKNFVLPLGEGIFKIGSTYEWNQSTLHTTDEAKAVILEKLNVIIDEDVNVIDQQAGVRPTTLDRRPFLGTHPTVEHLHVFNGLGTKGYLLAPLLSKEFCDFLIDGTPLHPEVQISRFTTEG